MRSIAPPVAALLAVLSMAGCEKRSAVPISPGPSHPAAPSTTVPPTTTLPAAKPGQPLGAVSKPTVKDAVPPVQAELDTYNDKLAKIIYRRDKAENVWYAERRAADKRLMKEGPTVLLPIFDRYARAVERATREMQALKPPAAAEKVHQAITASFDRLGANLDTLVGVLHSDGGEDPSDLLTERKQIQAESADAVSKAVVESGFDIETFRRTARLVRKG